MFVGMTFDVPKHIAIIACYNEFGIRQFRFAVKFSETHIYRIMSIYCIVWNLPPITARSKYTFTFLIGNILI